MLSLVPKSKTKSEPDQAQYQLAFARADPAHIQAPGLFRSLNKRTGQRSTPMRLVYQRGDRELIFDSPQQMSATDACVLLALIGFGGLRGVTPDSCDVIELQAYFVSEFAAQRPLVVHDVSISAIAREIGLSSNAAGSKAAVFDAVLRLCDVRITERRQGGRAGSKVPLMTVSWQTTGRDRRLTVALNPWLASAVLSGGQCARIDMSQLRSVRSDIATLLLLRLSALIDEGVTRAVRLETLLEYVHATDGTDMNRSTQRGRKCALMTGIAEIKGQGWQVRETSQGLFAFTRPVSS